MPVLTLTHESDPREVGELVEAGLSKKGWTLQADARIKTANNSTGVGPLVYVGKPKDSDGNVDTTNGEPRDAIFIFYTSTDVRRAEVFGKAPVDIVDTVTDYLTNHGGNVTTMNGLAPAVA